MQQHEDAMQRSAQEPTLEKTRSKPRVKLTDERPGARFRRNARKIEIVDHGTELMNGRKRRCVDYQELDASQKPAGALCRATDEDTITGWRCVKPGDRPDYHLE